jgi:hypothetical protein
VQIYTALKPPFRYFLVIDWAHLFGMLVLLGHAHVMVFLKFQQCTAGHSRLGCRLYELPL